MGAVFRSVPFLSKQTSASARCGRRVPASCPVAAPVRYHPLCSWTER